MRRLIEQAKRQAVAFEQMLDGRINTLVRPSARPLEPLEIRNAILREIEAQVIPGPNGTYMFPYNRVTVEWRGRSIAEDVALEATLDGIEVDARSRVERRCGGSIGDCTLQIVRLTAAPEDWTRDQLHRVSFDRVIEPRPVRSAGPPVTLVLALRGKSGETTYRLAQRRMDIGRTPDVRDREGRMIRRNTMVVSDDFDPHGTVSRRHAHITVGLDADGRTVFSLFDDGSRYGTRIVRDGETVSVHAGTRGVRLRDGDELHFGDVIASVRLES